MFLMERGELKSRIGILKVISIAFNSRIRKRCSWVLEHKKRLSKHCHSNDKRSPPNFTCVSVFFVES